MMGCWQSQDDGADQFYPVMDAIPTGWQGSNLDYTKVLGVSDWRLGSVL